MSVFNDCSFFTVKVGKLFTYIELGMFLYIIFVLGHINFDLDSISFIIEYLLTLGQSVACYSFFWGGGGDPIFDLFKYLLRWVLAFYLKYFNCLE